MMTEFDLPERRMPSGFSEEDFSFSKLYKCVQEGGQRTMCDVVRAMYAHPLVKSEGGTMLLRDYFKKVLRWSSAKIKSKIGQNEQHLLEVDMMTEELDISIAYKVMVEACVTIYNELSIHCRNQINCLKKLRNKVSHKYGCIGLNVESEIDTLKVVLRDIYEGVGTVLNKDFTANILAMEKSLGDIYEADVRQYDIASYEQDIQNFKNDKKHKLISRGRKELEAEYRKLRVLNPCTWMMDEEVKKSSVDKFHVDKIFTPLRTEDSREEIKMKNILNVTKQISGEPKLPPALLLHGLAGCGKTSLCHYILRDWYSKEEEVLAMSDFDLVLLVNVRTVRSSSLKEYLTQQLIFQTSKDFIDSDHIIILLKELDILFIIDGYDEANDKSLELIEEIFAKFGEHRIILTTRPEFHRDAALLSRKYHVDYLLIEICGFDAESLKEYTVKVFKAIEENPVKCKNQTKEFLQFITSREKVLGKHLRLPLTLALLIYLWRDNPHILNKVTTSTCLYFQLFKLCQKKLQERLKLNQDSKIIEELVLFLGEQAWDLLHDGRITISDDIKKKIENECERKKINETELMSAFLMCEYNDSEETCQRNYAFLHKTQMEYLAAEFLANDIRKKKDFEHVLEMVNDWRKYHEVIIFLTGHLAKERILKNYIPALFQLVDQAQVDRLNYNFWWNLFGESFKDYKVGHIIAEDKLPLEDWQLCDTHLIAGLKLLIGTKVELKTLRIEIANGVEPYEIPEFLDIMKSMRDELRSRYNKHKPILVELYFWRHNEYDFDKPSDEFLRTLNPWGHLVNFTGGLGEQEEGKEVLSYCFKLKTIRVRVMTPGALRSLSNSLSRIYKSVRTLRITLAMPPTCPPESLARLDFRGNLEITMQGIRDEDGEWLVAAVKQVGGERTCQHIFLQKSEVTFTGIMWLLEKFRRIFQGKFSIETVNEPSEKEIAQLEKNQQSTHIAINWI